MAFLFDGKNAKNAFLSYPDRVVRFVPADDSVYVLHYKRELKDGVVAYNETVWHTEVTSVVGNSYVVITVPWHDTAILPFHGRRVGFAAFVVDADGATQAAVPQTAKYANPGTWGDLVYRDE